MTEDRANDIDLSIKVEASTFRPGDSGGPRGTARLIEKIINEGKVRASYPLARLCPDLRSDSHVM